MTVPQTTIEDAIRATRSDRADSRSLTKSPGALPVAIGIVLALLGSILLCGGAWLVARGGSSYYAVTGAAVIATGYLLVRRRAAALYVYASMLAATTIWSIAEVGFDWWQLVPRLGGKQEMTEYTDQWTFGATLDLNQLVTWRDATFQIVITDRNGKDLGAAAGIGNNQLIQEVYGRGQPWHLTVFALDQQFFDGALDWRIGRLPVSADIHGFSCDFQNLTFCGAQPGNIVGDYWVNWPTSQWGTRLKLRTSAETYVQLSAYQISPDYVDDEYARNKGLSLDFPETEGWLLPLEFGWTPQWKGLPGSYKAGVWYNTAGGDDLVDDVNHQPRALTGDAPRQHDSRYGAYVSFQQQLTGETANDGWVIFFNATQADTATSATDRQIALGGEYHGPFGRPYDFIGIAVGTTQANGRQARYQRLYNETHPDDRRLVHDGNEYVGEVFYSFSPMRSMQLRANLQYIHNPGGTDHDDAFVAGLKTVISF